MRQGDWFQTSICFLKKTLNEVKGSGEHLSFNMFFAVLALNKQ